MNRNVTKLLSAVLCFYATALAGCRSDSAPTRTLVNSGNAAGAQTSTTGVAPTATTGTSTPSTGTAALSCDQLWTLMGQQQPVGKVFTYNTQIQATLLTHSVTRTETITISTADQIARTVAINDAMLQQFLGSAVNYSITITHAKFLEACQAAGSNGAGASGVAFDNVAITGISDAQIQVAGRQFNAKKIDMRLDNAKFSSYTVSGTMSAWIAADYPGLPLQQVINISQASVSLLNGAVINDTIQALP